MWAVAQLGPDGPHGFSTFWTFHLRKREIHKQYEDRQSKKCQRENPLGEAIYPARQHQQKCDVPQILPRARQQHFIVHVIKHDHNVHDHPPGTEAKRFPLLDSLLEGFTVAQPFRCRVGVHRMVMLCPCYIVSYETHSGVSLSQVVHLIATENQLKPSGQRSSSNSSPLSSMKSSLPSV